MSATDANYRYAQHALTNYVRKLTRLRRELTAAERAEVARLKAAVQQAKQRL